jgi:hypothetical protein
MSMDYGIKAQGGGQDNSSMSKEPAQCYMHMHMCMCM